MLEQAGIVNPWPRVAPDSDVLLCSGHDTLRCGSLHLKPEAIHGRPTTPPMPGRLQTSERVMRSKHMQVLAAAFILTTTALVAAIYYRREAMRHRAAWLETLAILEENLATASWVPPPTPGDNGVAPLILNQITVVTQYVPQQLVAQHAAPAQPVATTVSYPPVPSSDPSTTVARAEVSPARETVDLAQQRRDERHREMEAIWTQRTNYFRHRDISRMSNEDLEEYNLMVDLLEHTWTLGQRLREGVPAPDRWQVIINIRSNLTALAPLLDAERGRELYDLAVAMGHGDREARAFVSYVNNIVSNTSIRTLFPSLTRGGLRGRPSS